MTNDSGTTSNGVKEKVLYLITKANFGGAQRYVYDLATNLPKDHYEVAVACGMSDDGVRAGGLAARLTAASIPVIEIPNLGRDIIFIKEIRAFFAILDVIRSAKPDILHVNSSKAGGLGALAGRILGVKKIIFTIHGWPFWEPRNVMWRFLVWSASFLTLLLATRGIAVSEKDLLGSPLRTKTLLVRNGVAPFPMLSREAARDKIHAQGSPEEILIGTIAELTRNKRIDAVVRAAQGISEARFVIIGDGEEREYLHALARSLGVEKQMIFVGALAEASQFLKAFDIFVLPSRKEGLPYTILEAGMAGVPVIASNVGGIPEIITHNETGILVSPNDDALLHTAIQSLIKDAELRHALGNKLQVLVENGYRMSAMIQKTLAVYER